MPHDSCVKWNDKIDLFEALLGLPGRSNSQNEDVSKLARVGGFIGLGFGVPLSLALGSILPACLVAAIVGSFIGGGVGLWRRRSGLAAPQAPRLRRNVEIVRCVGLSVAMITCLVLSLLTPNALNILATFFFGWFAVRYFQRQRSVWHSSQPTT